jgi:uncharacterized protein
VTGASGLVGRALCARLTEEDVSYCVLSRDPDRARRTVPGAATYRLWQPIEHGRPWAELIEQSRAIVHLASPLVAPGRWTPSRRREVYDACVTGIRGLISALSEARSRPEVLVSASTVSYYAFDVTGEDQVDEGGIVGGDFFSRLTADWEAEALQAERYGVRTVVVRSALVLGRDGALPRLRRAARVGLGRARPPGTQRQPWIHLEDEVGLLLLALGDRRVKGALNAVAPQRASADEFMGTLRALVGSIRGVTSPGGLLEARFGAAAVGVTEGRSAIPGRAVDLGFRFRQPDLEDALRQLLGG